MEIEAKQPNDGFLDLLIVLSENRRLLLVIPLVLGVIAFAVAFLLPPQFTSKAILDLPIAPPATISNTSFHGRDVQSFPPSTAQAAAIMASPSILDSVIENLKLSDASGVPLSSADLAGRIKVVASRDGLLRLEVSARTPQEAQKTANAIIDTWLRSTAPQGEERTALEKRLEYATLSLAAIRQLQDRLVSGGRAQLSAPASRSDLDASAASIGVLQARYFLESLNIPKYLQGLTRDVVKQPPTLSMQPSTPHKALIAALAALIGLVSTLFWISGRHVIRIALEDPITRLKLGRIGSNRE